MGQIIVGNRSQDIEIVNFKVIQNRESNPDYANYRKTFSFRIRELFPIV
jgi:hypothetical protein